MDLIRRSEYVWEIPRVGDMRVPGRIYSSEAMLAEILEGDCLKQVKNVAQLPGVVGYSWAMPDVHLGYGFPIGGVAATAFDEDGVVSPGGVGYDINCGVRMMAAGLKRDEVTGRMDNIIKHLFKTVPCGANPHESGMGHLNAGEMKKVIRQGARFAVDRGFGCKTDLEYTEDNGRMAGADPDVISERAIERGRRQLGSLGSGNHFLEIGYVEKVYSAETARVFGLEEDDVTVMVHTGSRGFGHQVCTDFLRSMAGAASGFSFSLPDRQLAAAPLSSDVGRDYLAGMAGAANFAWANRQVVMTLGQRAIASVFGLRPEQLEFRLLYDISHNIAKVEHHRVENRRRKLCVHRKGATRALPPGDSRIPPIYRDVGQPVLVPGDMGTVSYLCVGSAMGEDHPFHSSCHGAGRRLSRRAAIRRGKGRSIQSELADRGITVAARNQRTLSEEMPEAYKNVTAVVDVMQGAGLLHRVVRIRPVGVIKG